MPTRFPRRPISTNFATRPVVRGNYSAQPAPGIHWFFARGLAGHDETIDVGPHRSWVKSYKRELGKQVDSLQAAVSPTPVSVVILWSQTELSAHLRTLLEELQASFGDLAEIVVVSEDRPGLAGTCEDADVSFIEMSPRSLGAGIAGILKSTSDGDVEECALPMPSGASLSLKSQDRLWLSEELELVHLAVGADGEDSPDEFRRGALVSWRNLQLRHDCDRDLTAEVSAQVEDDLRRRETVRINLYHAPGAGGSTVGRRVLWDLHHRYPAAVLHNYTLRATPDRLAKVAALTENSVLVVVDGGEHAERDVDDLYELLKAQQVPVVLLQVLRRFKVQRTGKRQFWLDAELSDMEADRFRNVYTVASPATATDLARLATRRGDRERSAFFFGLTAFGQDFQGLRPYVAARAVPTLTELQRRILIYFALAQYYGQQTVPANAFAALLGLPRSRSVDISMAFASNASVALDLLLQEQQGEWRVTHQFVALEILQQMLAPRASQERRSVWRQGLSSWSKEFATFARGPDHTPGDRMLELVRRVYVYRDNTDLLGTERSVQRQFSQLIEDIPSKYGKMDVLRCLTEEFPEEAHFHAHLGRLLGLQGEFGEALGKLDRAISLQPRDPVLHHMHGMVLRYQTQSLISERRDVRQIIPLARQAQSSFEEARRLSGDLEHGYISETQMLIVILDYAAGKNNAIRSYIASPNVDPFFRLALERAEELLDRVQNLYAGNQPSQYILDCRARLQRMYGDYAQALQAWDNLLTRPEVSKPPVRRQVAWTILRRRNAEWDKLTPREVERVRHLMEENLEEEINDSTSLRLWLRAIRQSEGPPSLDSVIERVSFWKANTGSLDAVYYLYVLHILRAVEGSGQALADAQRALEECRAMARFRRDRTRSFEWIGHGQGIGRLVHQSRLGEWRDDFWGSTARLARLDARVKSIDAPQKGSIQVAGGVEAFFVPAKADFHVGRDENIPVTCYLGFSYEGPRAWSVERK